MDNIKNILVNLSLSEAQKAELTGILPSANYNFLDHENVTEKAVSQAGIILGPIPDEMIQNLPKEGGNLKWMQLVYAGSDHIRRGAFPKGAVLTNASGCYGETIAEYMLGMLLMVKKNLLAYHNSQLKGVWKRVPGGTSIEGSTTLVIGLGDIGGAFARRMKLLGSYIIGVRRTASAAPDFVDEMRLPGDIDSLLPRADTVALAMPATSETRHTLSASRISALRPSAVVLNVGRGTAIDTEALCDALYNGKIGGAALDVTDPEPLPDGHRLYFAPNCLITPHVSGISGREKILEKINNLVFRNFRAFVSGGEMENVVDFTREY